MGLFDQPINAEDRDIEQDAHTSPTNIPSHDLTANPIDHVEYPVVETPRAKRARNSVPKENQPTKRSILDLVAGLAPEPEVPEHPAVAERKLRIDLLRIDAFDFAQKVINAYEAKETSDLPTLERALKQLSSAADLFAKAIAVIPDNKVSMAAAVKLPSLLQFSGGGVTVTAASVAEKPKRPAKVAKSKPDEETNAAVEEPVAGAELDDEVDLSTYDTEDDKTGF